jgi:hypothetical protein
MFDKPCMEICTFTGTVERISKFEIGSAKLGLNNSFTHLGFEYRSSSIKKSFLIIKQKCRTIGVHNNENFRKIKFRERSTLE